MPSSRQRATRRRGAALAEFCVLLPILMLLLTGIWEVGRIIEVTQILDNAAREGARMAATGQQSNSTVQLAVCQYLKNAGLPDYTGSPSSYVTVNDLDNPGTDATAASNLDRLQVQVSIPFSAVRWSALSVVSNANTQLTGTATWNCSMDQVYPTTNTVPSGY